ncbi:hypothetical protein Q1695_009285 [Nippostrongylus brasiliensis]|nr:hypothetical protein Q1695_009285 [Nippostrongylus brasiliensis]
MVGKNRKRLKRREVDGRSDEKEVNEIPSQRRRVSDDDVVVIDEKENKKMEADSAEERTILPTRESLACQLLVALRSENFVIVEGPIGSGKTFLAWHAGKNLNLPLKVMQMGDQIDSKSLLGSYSCTEIAGQFVWKPSNFTRWLAEKSLILLEDIDLSNADVISAIVQLVAERSVVLPNGEVISLHKDVRLMATTSGKGKKSSVLDGVPVRIVLDPFTDEELRRLISKGSPRIAHLAKTLISIFRLVEGVPPTSNSRRLTSTDLLRGCARISKLSDLSSNIGIFTELIDVWCLADTLERSMALCRTVAAPLSITDDQISFHFLQRQPRLSHDDQFTTIGRCRISTLPYLHSIQKYRLGHTRNMLQLTERLAVCVQNREPVLLVGETGVGKTSVVQCLASMLNMSLKVVNLSPSTDTDDLISGYKPTTIFSILKPFTDFYNEVFSDNFNVDKNQRFLSHLEICLSSGRYHDYLAVTIATAEKALLRTGEKDVRWASVAVQGRRILSSLNSNAALFAISRGAILEAVQEGHWLLIDEVNLAPPESLDAIVHAISGKVHPNFRLFACMNPATDAGKRKLPEGVRTKFTEFFVPEIVDPHQLALVVSAYLPSLKAVAVSNIVNFYLSARQLHPSTFNLRTLSRALMFAADNIFGSEDRSLYEAVNVAFLTNLDTDAKAKMRSRIAQVFRVSTSTPIPAPSSGAENYIRVEGYWISRGTELPSEDTNYVITKTVKQNLADIARITSSGRFPILLEGETSAGKTSIICHLARITGNVIVRINNHEHTDVQEYMGSYVGDENGRLVFREGALVTAVRNGSWVILDELNLAPTDIIEALNRLLDDNRELYVPEINTVIKPHPRFRLFATQNPAGIYGGRKRLSRALMSRFVVLRFDQIPLEELSSMVCVRCGVHTSAATKMINVLSKLRVRRSISGVFSAKDGLMTLRDVFRWAKRLVTDNTCDDWLQILANHGYFLLAGRCRNQKDVAAVVEVLESELKRKVEPDRLFASNSPYMPTDIDTEGVVMTMGMRRMLVMTQQAWLRNEAVLMIGETGGGKTSLAQVIGRGRLLTINCHEKTETADLLGRLRPRENGGFAWSDGVVISAMKAGSALLVDEISLAEDSVLERLNPLFEEDRTLLLSDAGVDAHAVSACDGFQIIATMNPGGDYGKKELSKALRNRFTEVWSSCDYDECELVTIFDSRLKGTARRNADTSGYSPAKLTISWIASFFRKYLHIFRQSASVRDIVACAEIYSACADYGLPPSTAVFEAISSVFLDALNSQQIRMAVNFDEVRKDAQDMLRHLSGDNLVTSDSPTEVQISASGITVGRLSIAYGPLTPQTPKAFSLHASTCISNIYRIARGLLINKPILLEGAPGCGKSSTVMALATLTGNPITRLNLSDQTDLSDLFGCDVPTVLDDGSISFRWEDGPVLQAIKRGEWVLLDEMNLASQAVLEGLNACFDHRRILHIPELNRTFEIPPNSNCRFFACQNPRSQGGNRRALPKSFVNRFTNIYVEDLKEEDILIILSELEEVKRVPVDRLKAMVLINSKLSSEHHLLGGPFSFNLRDLLRWFHLLNKNIDSATCFHMLYVKRMRSEENRHKLISLYEKVFGESCVDHPVVLTCDEEKVRIGQICIPRSVNVRGNISNNNRLLISQTTLCYQLATCVDMQWMPLIVGPRNSGKRSTVENLAAICGRQLEVIVLNSETDAQELIGSYEQVIDGSALSAAKSSLCSLLSSHVDESCLKKMNVAEDVVQLEIAAETALIELSTNHPDLVEECRELLASAARTAVRFEWIDSVFVRAYLNGHWLLIEDVNLCSAAVLDRLNSCLESDGRLVISERQSSFTALEPHPNFRVFLSMDHRNGEISRAMRNRSVEMFVTSAQQWNRSPSDVLAVASSYGKTVSAKLSNMLCSLSTERQLHFCALLSGMSVEEACRTVGLEYADCEGEEQRCISVVPFIRDIFTDCYEEWLLNSWKICQDDGADCTMFLALLSTSTKVLRGKLIQKVFGGDASHVVNRLLEITRIMKTSSCEIDPRFNHNVSNTECGENIQRFVVVTICEWISFVINTVAVSPNSAEHYSRTISQFNRTAIGFKNLQLIAKVVDAIVTTLKEASHLGGENEVFSYCLRLALFVVASRRPLDPRTGCAPLYLAWDEIREQSQMRQDTNSRKSALCKLVEQMSEGWPVDAHANFINKYLPLYKEHRQVEPFRSAEEFERFSSLVLSPTNGSDQFEPMDITREDDKGHIAVAQTESPITKALNLASVVREIQRFFSTGVVHKPASVFRSQEVLNVINWRDEISRRFAHGMALMNSELFEKKKVLSLNCIDAFSAVFLSFWNEINFDSSLSSLSVSHLMQSELRSLATQLWRLASNSPIVSHLVKEELMCAIKGLPGWTTDCSDIGDGWEGRLQTGLIIMSNALPPAETLDPVIFEEEKSAYQANVFDAVNRPLTVLSKWRDMVSRQPPECDSCSVHPVIASLWDIREEMKSVLEQLQDKPVVFRQDANQYTSMCKEMRSFYGIVSAVVPVLHKLSSDADSLRVEFDSSQLSVAAAQLRSFAVSASGFCRSMLSKFGSFLDVSMTYMLGLEIFLSALHEACDLIEASERRRDLQVATAFPPKFEVKVSAKGLHSSELLAWCCRAASPMPLRLKAAVVRQQLSSAEEVQCNLEWVRQQWQKWYERNVAKAAEKDFVYRTKTEEEKEELDVLEFFSEQEQSQEVITDDDLLALLDSETEADCGGTDFNYATALLWLRHVLSGVGYSDKNLQSSDLVLLEELVSRTSTEKESAIDVYRTASLTQFRRAAEVLEPLAKRTRVIKERWPEQVSLASILESINNFFNVHLCTSLAKMSVLFENIIEQCEDWEKIADRENSLRHELAPVRELLVEWKKMEVRTWGEVLNRVEKDGRMRAQLVAFPLFDALFKNEDAGADNALIAMSTEWITNASLLDYNVRLRSIRCLAEWAKLLGRQQLSEQLLSVSGHFEQYLPLVEESLRQAREPADHALKDYVRIVKFNDLNLWNIKASSQKAHTHLYKIVRKFREAVGVQVSDVFDKLMVMDEVSDVSLPSLPECNLSGRSRRARQLANDVITKATTICDVSAAVELMEQTKTCDGSIRELINYQGDDEQKEKQQGYARNSRQRAVALVIKESQSIGLNARKAMVLDPEALTRNSLTDVHLDVGEERYVRKCAGGRNASIRKAVAPNDQLGVATRKHLVGIIDYGMAWILKCHKKLAKWEQSCALLSRKSSDLERLRRNIETGSFVDHQRISSMWQLIHERSAKLLKLTDAMKKRISLVPEMGAEAEQDTSSWEHPLSQLHSSSEELETLRRTVATAHSLSSKIQQTSKLLAEFNDDIYEVSLVESSMNLISVDLAELANCLEPLQKWFEYEASAAKEIWKEIISTLKINSIDTTTVVTSKNCALLFIQNLYQSIVKNASATEMRLMDRLDFALDALSSSGIEKVVAWVSQIVSDAAVGIMPECLDELAGLLRVVASLFSAMRKLLAGALQAFAILYYTVVSMSMQLFEKGYINPIPKAEKQESGQGNTEEAGEGGGMGEGEASSSAKDVTDEMEESGQIEGLQDDEVEPPSGSAGQNEKPIEMEEDFPEDIQDIDRNEAGENEKEDEESEEEPEPEDQLGDVDEPDEQQLDPKLWDENEKDQSPKGLDNESAAADNKTNEMAAREDDPLAADERADEKDDNEEDSNEQLEDDVENVDERDQERADMDVDENCQVPEKNEHTDDVGEEPMAEGEIEDGDSSDNEEENDEEPDGGNEEDSPNRELEPLEDNDITQNAPPGEEEGQDQKDETEAVEQGSGGEQLKEKNDQIGGVNEDELKENEEKKGEGQSKSNDNREASKGTETTANAEDANKIEVEEEDDEKKAERKRELAQDVGELEDKQEGEGEVDENASQMQDAPTAERQMVGAGSLEDAKQSKMDDSATKAREQKKPEMGSEEASDAVLQNDDTMEEVQQSAIHLAPEQMFNLVEELTKELTVSSIAEKTSSQELERRRSEERNLAEAEQLWTAMSQTVAILAAELAENLRLILEPQRASKMQGDYKSGKRLNMRRLIPYIASDYRKDRIWMRRTKKAQRDYQVLIAVDDSASMNENKIHQVTCESVCIVEDALRRCDAGAVSVCSFGSDVKIINAFGDHMIPGPELLQKLTFNQSSTDLLLLLNKAKQLLEDVRTPTSEHLLIIISDGRGALAQGVDKVKAALSALEGVTVLFIILDSGPKSICDLSVASFQGDNVVLTPYLATFPFPFYAIVKKVTQLPSILAESIRQWFEMTIETNSI